VGSAGIRAKPELSVTPLVLKLGVALSPAPIDTAGEGTGPEEMWIDWPGRSAPAVSGVPIRTQVTGRRRSILRSLVMSSVSTLSSHSEPSDSQAQGRLTLTLSR
jgi:hypothetical protein